MPSSVTQVVIVSLTEKIDALTLAAGKSERSAALKAPGEYKRCLRYLAESYRLAAMLLQDRLDSWRDGGGYFPEARSEEADDA